MIIVFLNLNSMHFLNKYVRHPLQAIVAYLLFLILPSYGQMWSTPTMALEEIKPGMRGIGKTVFYGERVEEFGIEVVDVMKNIYPQRNIIIVRLTGEKAERMGVVSGMSGSPVYINNKLVGALAMRFGEFQKEPIAGVTPFSELIQVAEQENERNETTFSSASLLHDYLQGILIDADNNFWSNILQKNPTATPFAVASMRQIESPMILSGFSELVLSQFSPVLSSFGFVPTVGGASEIDTFQTSAEIEPGSAISQVFISGDLSIDATGTLTAVEGSKILAFGHYIFNLGPTNLPMARSHILVTIPSLLGSNKMATAKEIIGVVRQDRLTGIYGEIGRQPTWIPVHLELQYERKKPVFFTFRLASDPAVNNLMPFFLRTALFQAMVAGKLGADPCTVQIVGEIKLSDSSKVNIEDFFSYEERLGFLGAGSDVARAADIVARIVGALQVNDFVTPAISGIDLTTRMRSGENLCRIESMRLDRLEANPGDSLTLTIQLRQTDGNKSTYHRKLHLPTNLQTKNISIFAGGAAALTLNELQSNPDKFRPSSFSQLLSILENRRRTNILYIQIREPAAGMTVNGQELNALPPSILDVMDGRSGEKFLRERLLFEDVVNTQHEITGLKRISLRIIQPKKSSAYKEDNLPSLRIFEW